MAINASVGNTGESDQEMGINGHAVALLQPACRKGRGACHHIRRLCRFSLSDVQTTDIQTTDRPGGRNGLGLI